jgi:hypothetical protein
MRARSIVIAILAAAACAGAHPRVSHAPADAPAALRARVAEVLGADATISAEGPARARVYEAATQTKLEIELDDTGLVTQAELALPPALLPAAVAAAAAARGQATEAEVVVTPAGVAFEVEIATGAGTIEVMLDASGALLEDDAGAADDEDDEDGEGVDD